MNTTDWKAKLVWIVIGVILGTIIGMWIGYTLGARTASEGDSVGTKDAGQVTQPATNTDESNVDSGTLTSDTGVLIGVTNPVFDESDKVTVENQTAGYTVTVAHADLAADGWVAVHEVLDGDVIGNILGAARRDTGSYDSVVVDLLRSTEAGKSYAVVLYKDNGNKEFDLTADLPLTDVSGNPIVTRFSVDPSTSPAGL